MPLVPDGESDRRKNLLIGCEQSSGAGPGCLAVINPKLLGESTYIHQVDEGAYASLVEDCAARPTV